jgi:hypothetical protein
MVSLHQIFDAWHYFFHAPEPVATLCLFRVLFGLLMVVDALLLAGDAQSLIGPRGIFPYHEYVRTYQRSRMTLFHLLPDTPRSVGWIVVTHLISAIFVTIGLYTKLSAAVALVTLISIHHRSPASFYGGDTVIRLMLFQLCFSHCGHALSIDAWIHGRDAFAAMADAPGSPWAMRLMQIQLSIIYLWTTIWKLNGVMWRSGTAIFYAIQNKSLHRGNLPRWMLRRFPMKIVAYSALVTEGALGTLVWIKEFRTPTVFVGIVFHLCIEFCMEIYLFEWIMCVCLLLFLDPIQVAAWFH